MMRVRNGKAPKHTHCHLCGAPIAKGHPVARFTATELGESVINRYEHPSCADTHDAELAEERALIDNDDSDRE